jgi:cytosine/adenosine deaminase-related metal-dependent hydrolase
MIITNAWTCKINEDSVEPVFGDIRITDGKISGINEKPFDPKQVFSKDSIEGDILNAGGRVVTIPLINFHDHFYSRLAKGLPIKDKMDNFHNILKNLWWKLDVVLDKEMIRASAQMAVLESIRQGVTYIFDHHSSPGASAGSLEIIAGIMEELGLRGVLCFETTDRNGNNLAAKGIKENKNFVEKNTDDIKSLLGLHTSFTLSDESLSAASEILKKYDLGIHIHLCEDKIDSEESIKNYGASPIERLRKYNLLNNKSILSHGIHLTEKDFETIAKYGCAIAYNPDSNLNNAVGLARLKNIPAEIPIITGTDGMHSNPARSLKQLFLLSRHSGMSFDETFALLKRIYYNQLEFVKKYFSDFSSLNIGNRADLILWDYIPPTPISKDNFWGHYIYGIVERPVHSVMQKGRLLLKGFTLQFDDTGYNKNITQQGYRLFNKFSPD